MCVIVAELRNSYKAETMFLSAICKMVPRGFVGCKMDYTINLVKERLGIVVAHFFGKTRNLTKSTQYGIPLSPY